MSKLFPLAKIVDVLFYKMVDVQNYFNLVKLVTSDGCDYSLTADYLSSLELLFLRCDALKLSNEIVH